MHSRTAVFAAMLVMAPTHGQAADLVVWWDEGRTAEEREAVREIIAAFEQDTGKQVELVFHPEQELPDKIRAALAAGQPPDFAFGYLLVNYMGEWALDDRLVDLAGAGGHLSDLFDPDVLAWMTWRNARTGQRALYGLPMGRTTTHLHVWKEPARARRPHGGGYPKGVGGVLVFLVRPSAASRAPGHGPRRHLERRSAHVDRVGHPERLLPVLSCV
jgi:ABC-type glycerol-3-phosphate transport system substrate-binding protein